MAPAAAAAIARTFLAALAELEESHFELAVGVVGQSLHANFSVALVFEEPVSALDQPGNVWSFVFD